LETYQASRAGRLKPISVGRSLKRKMNTNAPTTQLLDGIQMEKMILVSTPWPMFNRPSIQLGALKAYLQGRFEDLKVNAHHFYLVLAVELGYDLYRSISKRTWLAECAYAALLYPDRVERIEKLFYRQASGRRILKKIRFESLIQRIKRITDDDIESIPWNQFGLVGLTICLCQLTSTLYYIKKIKSRYPALPVVVGGSTLSGTAISSFIRQFPEIDFIVRGEGEKPLADLVASLRAGTAKGKRFFHEGHKRMKKKPNPSNDFNQLTSLSRLPIPDYDDYFLLLNRLKPAQPFFPILPVEISRGCWWQKIKKNGTISGCAFCNLNIQWHGYRVKRESQVAAEIERLTRRHQTLSIAIMDNVLPRAGTARIFNGLGRLKKDLQLFSEIRPSTSMQALQAMKSAGTNEVQIGIESLSSNLLLKMNKGATAVQNMEIMKNCEELGILNNANLLLGFPGSDERDVAETIKNIEFATYFRPLKPVFFWLGIGSPVWRHPERFGIRSTFNHHHYKILFPASVYRSVDFMMQTYRGDVGFQRRIWRPVKPLLKKWKREYNQFHASPGYIPILTYRDGRDFLILQQRRLNQESLTHRLTGTSRLIYLYCRSHRSIRMIKKTFPQFTEDRLVSFLKMMVAKKLMFTENDRYLSLAVARSG
jgi:ribosomal peptide maturation radical SAM protein 1